MRQLLSCFVWITVHGLTFGACAVLFCFFFFFFSQLQHDFLEGGGNSDSDSSGGGHRKKKHHRKRHHKKKHHHKHRRKSKGGEASEIDTDFDDSERLEYSADFEEDYSDATFESLDEGK